jgi:hypothetical protein
MELVLLRFKKSNWVADVPVWVADVPYEMEIGMNYFWEELLSFIGFVCILGGMFLLMTQAGVIDQFIMELKQ